MMFATSAAALPVGPFNFFHPEQKALSKMVMQRMAGQYGVEFDTISYYWFRETLLEVLYGFADFLKMSKTPVSG